jgi:hypothetical protein
MENNQEKIIKTSNANHEVGLKMYTTRIGILIVGLFVLGIAITSVHSLITSGERVNTVKEGVFVIEEGKAGSSYLFYTLPDFGKGKYLVWNTSSSETTELPFSQRDGYLAGATKEGDHLYKLIRNHVDNSVELFLSKIDLEEQMEFESVYRSEANKRVDLLGQLEGNKFIMTVKPLIGDLDNREKIFIVDGPSKEVKDIGTYPGEPIVMRHARHWPKLNELHIQLRNRETREEYIEVYDTNTFKRGRRIGLGNFDSFFAEKYYIPSLHSSLISQFDGKVILVDEDAQESRVFLESGDEYWKFEIVSISPDGKKIAFDADDGIIERRSETGNNKIVVTDLEGNILHEFVYGWTGSGGEADWSPDSRYIACPGTVTHKLNTVTLIFDTHTGQTLVSPKKNRQVQAGWIKLDAN